MKEEMYAFYLMLQRGKEGERGELVGKEGA